jgi:hypothetical protein
MWKTTKLFALIDFNGVVCLYCIFSTQYVIILKMGETPRDIAFSMTNNPFVKDKAKMADLLKFLDAL